MGSRTHFRAWSITKWDAGIAFGVALARRAIVLRILPWNIALRVEREGSMLAGVIVGTWRRQHAVAILAGPRGAGKARP